MNELGRRMLGGLGFWFATGAAPVVTACAHGNAFVAEPVDAAGGIVNTTSTPGGLSVSARELADFSSPYLGVVLLRFDNPTADFVQIDSISLAFGPALDEHVSIPVGSQISGWGEAIAMRTSSRFAARHALFPYSPTGNILSDVDRFEQSRFLRGATAPSSEQSLTAPNMHTLSASAGVNPAELVPSDHLLAGPFSVPPMLFATKWLLVESDARIGACLERMVVTVQAAQRPPQRLLVQFRDKTLTQSRWQSAECTTPGSGTPVNPLGV